MALPRILALIMGVLRFCRVETWQDHTTCGYQRAPLRPEASIVGGRLAQEGEWPWIASLFELGQPKCGATLITPQWLLTAAHCIEILNDGSAYSVTMGTNNIRDVSDAHQRAVVEEIFIHPHYIREDTDFDIALVKLRRPMNMTDYVTTACLPDRTMRDTFLPGRAVTMAGWGTLYQGGRKIHQLREVSVALVNMTVCRAEFYPFHITDNMLCSGPDEGGKDSCQGDSGGPMVSRVGNQWWLVGVIIGGVGCAVPGFRGVSSSTIAFQDWIQPIFEGGVPTKKTLVCDVDFELTCQGGWCNPYETKCDGYPDCRLKTDEAFCGGVLKLYDPVFYQRFANSSSAVVANALDLHDCAIACINAEFDCAVFEYHLDITRSDPSPDSDTQPVYRCLIAEAGHSMMPISVEEAHRWDLLQFVRRKNVTGDVMLTAPTGLILSPSFTSPAGQAHLSSTTLTWNVRLSEIYFNTITFTMLSKQATGQVDCADWSSFALLSVNGNVTAGMVGMTRCLNEFEVGESFDVDATEVLVTFYASDIINTGFMLDYTGRWLCNQTFIASPGLVSSPRFYTKTQYPPSVYCHYSITAPPDHVISLHLESFVIEPDSEEGSCEYDSLSIYDGDNADAHRLELLCGYSQAPVSVSSTSSSLYLVFATDATGEYPGFAASYDFIHASDEDRRITTPETPSGTKNRDWFPANYRTHAAASSTTTTTAARSTLNPVLHGEVTLPSANFAESTGLMPITAIFKIILAVHLVVFLCITIVFAILYCRVKQENIKLQKNLNIYRSGNVIRL